MSQINPSAIKQHINVIFGRLPSSGYICVRGIGEKGTDGEGVFRDDKFIDLSQCTDVAGEITRHVERWSEHGRASFIVPAILSQPKGSSESVKAFCSMVVDLDSGNIDEKHQFLAKSIGQPTAVVYSGGSTEGQRKRHLWWTLNDPCQDITSAIQIRHQLAEISGGDMQFGLGVEGNQFGRAHQPVRIAGSVHAKGGVKTPVTIDCDVTTAKTYGIQFIKNGIATSGHAPGVEIKSFENALFQPEKSRVDLNEKVYEGSNSEKNRWTQFNRVAGHYLHIARRGDMTVEDAKQALFGWMETNMVPPWPLPRAEKEWHSVYQRDLANYGPFPEPIRPMIEDGDGLEIWAAHRWSMSPPPPREFLVDKFILAGKHQLLVAEGGAGKTFLMLDLAIKIASYDKDEDTEWCGMKVMGGGTVVILTTEDDKDELHRRMYEIDGLNKRKRAGDRLIVFPTINNQGAFPFVETDAKFGEAKASRRWVEFFALLKRLPDLKLLVVDTLNSTLHGEENSATVINEFVRIASQVCGELNAALIITHHIRKQGDEPIRNVEDMKSSIRGSSALPAAFRSVIGIWHCPDFDRRLPAMSQPIKRGMLWKMAIIKANNPEMFDGEKTLLRTEAGLLTDVTHMDVFSSVNNGERHAWLALAIEEAAREGHPYSIEGKNSKSGLYKRRSELPESLRQIGPGEFQRIVDDLLLKKIISACSAKGGKEKKWLDIKNGPIASDEEGAELNSGAYDPPRWDLWEYDEASCMCHPVRK